MARKDSEHQKKSMSILFRGKAIFKPLNTGHIDEHVSCVREWIANIPLKHRRNSSLNHHNYRSQHTAEQI